MSLTSVPAFICHILSLDPHTYVSELQQQVPPEKKTCGPMLLWLYIPFPAMPSCTCCLMGMQSAHAPTSIFLLILYMECLLKAMGGTASQMLKSWSKICTSLFTHIHGFVFHFNDCNLIALNCQCIVDLHQLTTSEIRKALAYREQGWVQTRKMQFGSVCG